MIATPVRIADPAAAKLLSPGSTIGVLAAWEEGQPAHTIAEDITVITIPAPDTDDSHGTLVVLATTPAQAANLAAAQTSGRLSITIKPNLR
ncbi:RcpC/CpaB family pilus assembly protein [Nonomuraea sp. M3C6]|uniref:RcpC/CpaB family pilus assembly protein n=1 Tax=Nonomuraea marmarensis TaxID=3351344 RepID=A0ABW7A8V7_9ACTN